MEKVFRLILFSAVLSIGSCAIPGAQPVNPWDHPNRGFGVWSDAEKADLIASFQPCIEHARESFADALDRYETGQLRGAALSAIVFDDDNYTSWIRVDLAEADKVIGELFGDHVIEGRSFADGSRVSIARSDVIDWYISYRDRPPEGNFLGKYLLLKQDGLAAETCDPDDIAFRRYRYFTTSYSFVPPGTQGWEMRGPGQGTDMSMQKRDESLGQIDTLSSYRYEIAPASTDRELIEMVGTFGRYGRDEGSRYNVIRREARPFDKAGTRCARLDHVVEDKKALLTQSGKRGFMIRDVQVLMCAHPADERVAVVLIYSHRHRRGEGDPEFVDRATRVFESLAFTRAQ